MVKKFTIPFASQGDANDIPDALQVDGKVSFTQGFSYDYERPYDDPQAKDIAREDMNGLFKAITTAVGELQTLGASEWSSAISYPKGVIVYFEKDLYISQVDDNQNEPPQNWVSITSIANDSLKKVENLSDLTDKVAARTNLGLGSSATLNKTDVLGTSTNLVATQKLVNDTKINLENSKQDKLTFTGTGNVARMSEVNKKRDKTDNFFNGRITSEEGIQIVDSNMDAKAVFFVASDGFPSIWSHLKNTEYRFREGGIIPEIQQTSALGPEQWTEWVSSNHPTSSGREGLAISLTYALASAPINSIICRTESREFGVNDSKSRALYRRIIRTGR